MQIFTDKDNNLNLENSIVTIGTFDGLHAGHQKIISLLKIKGEELGLNSVVITFYPHPRTVVAKDYNIKLLTPIEEKKKLFENFGINSLLIVDFTQEFSTKTYKDFFEEILIKTVNAKHLVIGYDHKFGKDRNGNIEKLTEYTKEYNIGLTIVDAEEVNSATVSSTKIRNALLSGDVETTTNMLGRYYFLEGVVVEGAKRGRTLGFPTANLGLKEDNKLVPCNGVYFVKVKFDKSTHYGVANIGLRPTFNHVKEPITEVFILDFNKDVYGEKITVEFVKRMRDEKKFSSKEELENRIKLDVENAKKLAIEFNNN